MCPMMKDDECMNGRIQIYETTLHEYVMLIELGYLIMNESLLTEYHIIQKKVGKQCAVFQNSDSAFKKR